jgi:bile acid:Na+ symporter, BASS family
MKVYLALAGLPGLTGLFLLFQQTTVLAAPLGIVSLLLFALIAFRGYPTLRGFSFTLLIFAAVCTAITYPTSFLTRRR